ncbi:MAG: ABC transporter permease, partial [Candidatus Hodarchaeota archaeon]
MKILTKKIFREMRFNKFRSAIIILTIFTAISLGIGLVNMVGSVDVSVIANDEKLNNADLRTRLTEYISEDEVSSLLTESEKAAAGIIDLEGRIFEYASVVYQEKIYDAYLIGVDLEKNTINKLQLRSGTFPRVTNQVMVEQHFGSDLLYSTGAAVNDPLTISFRNATLDVTIAGFVADSEYLYVIDEQTEILSLGQLCVVYLPLDMLHEKFQLSGINEILVRTTERSQNAYQKADQVLSNAIGENRIQSVIYWDKTAEKKMLYQRMNAVENLGIAFGLFSLVAGSIAIYNSLSKLVMSQRIHIGLYGALGARPWVVLSHYVGFGTILGIIGVITGWLGATLITYGLLELGIKPLCGLVITKVAFVPGIWIVGTLLTVIVVFVFSLLSTLPVLRLTPNEAMKAPYSTSELGNEPLLERIMRPLGIFNRLVSKIPLRTVFMNKKRSLATAFAVAASMVILVASVSLVYDYTLGIERNYSDYEKYDVQVILQHPTSEQLIETWIQQHATGIRTVEGFIYTNVWIGSQRIPLQAFHQNSILRNYHVIEGTAELTKDTLLVGSVLAKELRVNLGDQLTLVFDPNVSLSVEVAGITGELLDNSLLWTIEGIQQRTPDIQGIGISENVTSFVFEYDEDLPQEEKTQLKQR